MALVTYQEQDAYSLITLDDGKPMRCLLPWRTVLIVPSIRGLSVAK